MADDSEPEWYAWVRWTLDRARNREDSYTLLDLLGELADSAEAREEGWRADTIDSFRRDLTHALDGLGVELRAHCGPVVVELESLMRAVDGRQRLVHRQQVGNLARRLAERIPSGEGLVAAVRDLMTEARLPHPRQERLDGLADLLLAQGAARGRARFGLLARIRELFTGERAFPSSTPVPAAMGFRIALIEADLRLEVSDAPCVVWLAYSDAILYGDFRLDVGPLRFFRVDWFVPNARRDDGQLFPEREELRAVLRLVNEGEYREDEIDARVVLVRVDLGVSAPVNAVDAATAFAGAVVSTATAFGGSGGWEVFGPAVLLVDGQVRGVTYRAGTDRAERPHPYTLGGTGVILAELGRQLGDRLQAGPMPPALTQVLAIYSELQELLRLDDRTNRPAVSRSVLAVQDRLVESVAAFGRLSGPDLRFALRRRWAAARWASSIAEATSLALNTIWREGKGRGSELDRELIDSDEYRRVLRLEAVRAHAQELVDLVTDPAVADFVRIRLVTLTDESARKEFERRSEVLSDLLDARHPDCVMQQCMGTRFVHPRSPRCGVTLNRSLTWPWPGFFRRTAATSRSPCC